MVYNRVESSVVTDSIRVTVLFVKARERERREEVYFRGALLYAPPYTCYDRCMVVRFYLVRVSYRCCRVMDYFWFWKLCFASCALRNISCLTSYSAGLQKTFENGVPPSRARLMGHGLVCLDEPKVCFVVRIKGRQGKFEFSLCRQILCFSCDQ
jgi:hypothetical protein